MGDVFFPLMLVCGFFGIIILVGIVFSYLWLRWLNAQMTKCPECGRKGAGELVNTDVINAKSYTVWKDARNVLGWDASRRRRVRVTENTYEDSFRCQFCGHQWVMTAQEKKESPVGASGRKD